MSALQFYSMFSTNLELPIPSFSVKPEHSVFGPEPVHPSSVALPRVRTCILATRASGEGLTFMNFQVPRQLNQLDNERKDWEKKDFISASDNDSSGTRSTLWASLVDICSSENSYSWWQKYTFHLAHETKHKFTPGGPKPLCSLTGLDTFFVSILALLCGNFHSTRDNRLMNGPSTASITSWGGSKFSPLWTHVPLQLLLLCGNWEKSPLGSSLA
jgi:hypothetical protein